MKVVCLFGSPRVKGNTATIANRFIETAEGLGADVKTYTLNKLTYRGCQACMTCKTKLDKCVLKDDLSEVLDAVRQADVLVLASPTYYGEVTSQTKGFIDRTYSYLVPDYTTNPNPSRLEPGKTMVMILAQANPDEKNFADIFPRYDFFFKWYGFTQNRLIRACGLADASDIKNREDILKTAEEVAKEVIK